MKILTVVGARPQFIKAAVVSRQFASFADVSEVIVHTGQHFDSNMSEIFFSQLGIPEPRYNLNISDLNHGAMTGRMLEKTEEVILAEAPDIVLVYGDTNSTLAAALAAGKQNIRLAHVEAGLRSFNMRMPEEINRILTDRISDLLFCPTQKAMDNLQMEGFNHFSSRVYLTGDVMYDAVLHFGPSLDIPPFVVNSKLKSEEYVLCTVHRQENTSDEHIRSIVSALNQIHQELPVIMPVHPRTRQAMQQSGAVPEFFLLEPLGYLQMMALLKFSRLVMTDSGGLQKEAYFMKRPCLTLRDETEWTELVDSGCNFLAGHGTQKIITVFEKIKKETFRFDQSFYGDGKAGEKIAALLTQK